MASARMNPRDNTTNLIPTNRSSPSRVSLNALHASLYLLSGLALTYQEFVERHVIITRRSAGGGTAFARRWRRRGAGGASRSQKAALWPTLRETPVVTSALRHGTSTTPPRLPTTDVRGGPDSHEAGAPAPVQAGG